MMRALACGISIVLISQAAFAQVTPPAFEVAEVQASQPGGRAEPGKGRFLPGGRVELPNYTIEELMLGAYGLQENMIVGGPSWLESDRFDIVAKAPPNAPQDTLFLMLQTLLAERFKLAIHREDKSMPAYALIVGKRGAKLKESAADAQSTCAWHGDGGRIQRECHNLTMADFARQMPGWGRANVDLPVVDLTGLKGAYDFQSEWTLVGRGADKPDADPGGSTIFDAMDQIGLKLELRKLPLPVIVIDHVERLPAAN